MSVSCRSQYRKYTMESLLENEYVKEYMDTFMKDEYPDMYMAAYPNKTDSLYDQKKVEEMAIQMNNVGEKLMEGINDIGDSANVFQRWSKTFSKEHKKEF